MRPANEGASIVAPADDESDSLPYLVATSDGCRCRRMEVESVSSAVCRWSRRAYAISHVTRRCEATA